MMVDDKEKRVKRHALAITLRPGVIVLQKVL